MSFLGSAMTYPNSEFGSVTEIRIPNLAVNNSLRPVQKSQLEFAECLCTPPFATVCRRRGCTNPARRMVDAPGDLRMLILAMRKSLAAVSALA